jgi:PhnB protein
MTRFGPYLLFDGNCAQAMTFYQKCLGGELEISTVAESTFNEQFPSDKQDRVVYAQLKSGPFYISASDWLHPTRNPKQGNAVCLHISRATKAELESYFLKLRVEADSSLLDELTEMPFGIYGALTDKFGIRWMFQSNNTD